MTFAFNKIISIKFSTFKNFKIVGPLNESKSNRRKRIKFREEEEKKFCDLPTNVNDKKFFYFIGKLYSFLLYGENHSRYFLYIYSIEMIPVQRPWTYCALAAFKSNRRRYTNCRKWFFYYNGTIVHYILLFKIDIKIFFCSLYLYPATSLLAQARIFSLYKSDIVFFFSIIFNWERKMHSVRIVSGITVHW